MSVRVHTPQHRQPNGRPIAIVSVVDHDLANKLLDAGKVDQMQEVRRFQSIMIEHHHKVRLTLCPAARQTWTQWQAGCVLLVI